MARHHISKKRQSRGRKPTKTAKISPNALLVDVPTACTMLSVKRTKLFEMLRPGGCLQRVKIGRKTLVTRASVHALAGQGDA